MSYTRLVAYSIIPALLMFVGIALGEIALILALIGGIAEALVIARFFDKRHAARGPHAPLPPSVATGAVHVQTVTQVPTIGHSPPSPVPPEKPSAWKKFGKSVLQALAFLAGLILTGLAVGYLVGGDTTNSRAGVAGFFLGSFLGLSLVAALASALLRRVLPGNWRWVSIVVGTTLGSALWIWGNWGDSWFRVIPFAGIAVAATITVGDRRNLGRSWIAALGVSVVAIMVGYAFVAPRAALAAYQRAATPGCVESFRRDFPADAPATSVSDYCGCTLGALVNPTACEFSPFALLWSDAALRECDERLFRSISTPAGIAATLAARDPCVDKHLPEFKEKILAAQVRQSQELQVAELVKEKQMVELGAIEPIVRRYVECGFKAIIDRCNDKSQVGYYRCIRDSDKIEGIWDRCLPILTTSAARAPKASCYALVLCARLNTTAARSACQIERQNFEQQCSTISENFRACTKFINAIFSDPTGEDCGTGL